MEENKKTGIGPVLLSVMLLLASCGMVYLLVANRVLPIKYQIIALILLILINGISFFLTSRRKEKKGARVLGAALTILGILVIGLGDVYLYKTVATLDKISESDTTETVQMSIVVMADSDIQSASNLSARKLIAPMDTDGKNLASFLNKIREEHSLTLSPSNSPSYIQGVRDLYEGKAEAMVINESYRGMIQEEYPNFDTETRVISEFGVVEEQKPDIVKAVDIARTPFNVYVSGIDTWGPINTVSRSDVNILMTMNPVTKRILLTSIPRDTYLPIAGGGNNQKDKLTHSGVYGIDSSVMTIENFLEIDVNYYARVNFSSLVKIIDEIGDIEVDNPQSFRAGKYSFPTGKVQMDGQKALTYARERYHVKDGDAGRGRNQERIIVAILEKLMSPEILTNYVGILNSLQDSVQTNMKTADLFSLFNMQIENPGKWNFEMNSIEGEGSTGRHPSYAMPGYSLYMMVPYEGSVKSTQNKIQAVMEVKD